MPMLSVPEEESSAGTSEGSEADDVPSSPLTISQEVVSQLGPPMVSQVLGVDGVQC